MNDFNRDLIEEFRTKDGKVTGPFAGAPLLLLTTTGARSGRRYTTPVVFTRDNGHFVVIASKGGAPENPDWYHNLVAHPDATIEVPGETIEVRAREAQGEERDRLYRQQADLMSGFAEYQQKTSRRIPVFVLEPAATS
jgi:deazaflavin-dependent oxidoreductase (nitroreductase family)